jgi:hypothetical protein
VVMMWKEMLSPDACLHATIDGVALLIALIERLLLLAMSSPAHSEPRPLILFRNHFPQTVDSLDE